MFRSQSALIAVPGAPTSASVRNSKAHRTDLSPGPGAYERPGFFDGAAGRYGTN